MKLYNCLGALGKSKEIQVCSRMAMADLELLQKDLTAQTHKTTPALKVYSEA